MSYVKYLIFLVLSLFMHQASSQVPFLDKLVLSEYVFSTMHDVPLDEQDSRWLRAKKVLKLGVALPDVPPFGITTYGREFSGVTADYMGVIAESLGLRVEG